LTVGEQYLGDFAAKLGLTQIDVAASDEQNRHQELDENLHAYSLITILITIKLYNDGYSCSSGIAPRGAISWALPRQIAGVD
jgi:hypothetical protein